MFNILERPITPQEMLLLKSLEPQGANLSAHPSEIFTQDYRFFVAVAFDAAKPFLEAGDLRKAIKCAKTTLLSLLSDQGGRKFIILSESFDEDCTHEN